GVGGGYGGGPGLRGGGGFGGGRGAGSPPAPAPLNTGRPVMPASGPPVPTALPVAPPAAPAAPPAAATPPGPGAPTGWMPGAQPQSGGAPGPSTLSDGKNKQTKDTPPPMPGLAAGAGIPKDDRAGSAEAERNTLKRAPGSDFKKVDETPRPGGRPEPGQPQDAKLREQLSGGGVFREFGVALRARSTDAGRRAVDELAKGKPGDDIANGIAPGPRTTPPPEGPPDATSFTPPA